MSNRDPFDAVLVTAYYTDGTRESVTRRNEKAAQKWADEECLWEGTVRVVLTFLDGSTREEAGSFEWVRA